MHGLHPDPRASRPDGRGESEGSGLRPQPVIDLRETPYRVRGFSVDLDPGVADVPDASAAVARRLARFAAAVPGLDFHLRGAGKTLVGGVGFLPELVELVSRLGLPPTRLVFDVVPGARGEADPASLVGGLERLRARGVRIGVDRLGLAPDSIPLLLAVRPDYIWIAESLVRGCSGDFFRRATVEAVSRLGWKFGAFTIADGVATTADAIALRDLGVSFTVGPWVGPGVDAELLAKAGLEADGPYSAAGGDPPS